MCEFSVLCLFQKKKKKKESEGEEMLNITRLYVTPAIHVQAGTFFFHLGTRSLWSLCLTVVSLEEIGEILDSPSCYQSYFAG